MKLDLPRARDPLTGELFSVYSCTGCGLGHTWPKPENPGRYYPEQYYGNRHGFTLRRCIGRRMGIVASAMHREPAGSLLDIGCGDGSFLLAAREAGWRVMGTELNPVPGRNRGLEVAEAVSEIKGSCLFDCITMWHTLEHMADIPSMLADAARLLKQNGRLIIAVPDYGGLQARLFSKNWLHLDVPRHLYHFDAQALQRSLDRAGFSIRRSRHQEFEYDLLGWSQSMLNCLLPMPNVFFDLLTGKPSSAGVFAKSAGLVLGALLTLLFLPALLVGTMAGRGGSLVVTAVKKGVA